MSRMSVRSTASATNEFGGVVLAVEHLQELGRRMRGDDFDFKEDDVSNLDVVVDAMHELEKERLHLHELLETQTIQGSVLRHRLLFYPAEIQKEIDEAVISARQSNAEAQKTLQETLESIYQNVEFLEEKQSRLEKENAVLHPERELIRQQHEEIISQLNQRMAEKAGMQITLNETRDKVRQANQCILELEDGIVQLKEDLIQERQEARDEKRRLKSQANDVSEKTKQQRATNFEKKKQLDSLKEDILESNGKLESLKKSVRRLDNSRGKLEDKEKVLSMNLKKEIGDNAELRDNGIAIREAEKKETAEYEAQREQLEAKIKQLDAAIAKQHKLSMVVNAEHSELTVEVSGKVVTQNNNRAKVKELEKMLQTAKSSLSSKAEENGNLENENEKLQLNIEEMEESHKIVVAQLNSHIEEYRGQLGKERKERMELQVQRDSVQKDLEEIKTDSQNFVTEVNKKINEGKTKHQELSQEGTSLQKQLREDDGTLRKLQKELSELQAQFKEKSTEKKGQLAQFEQEVAEMETTVEDKKDLLAAQTPAFEELEARFEEKTLYYDDMKKDIVKKKNMKSTLLEAIKKAKMDKEKISSPQAGMMEMLSNKRHQSIVQLKCHAEETRDVEKDICVVGCRLAKVQEENEKFDQHIKKLQDRIEDLRTQQKDHLNASCSLKDELQKLKDELVNGWREDREMEQMFAERDEAVVRELAQILVKTEKRETKIADISSQLQAELVVLGDFLDNVSRRRPIDTRDGKRPSPIQQMDSISSTSNLNASKNQTSLESKPKVTNSAESNPTNSTAQLNAVNVNAPTVIDKSA